MEIETSKDNMRRRRINQTCRICYYFIAVVVSILFTVGLFKALHNQDKLINPPKLRIYSFMLSAADLNYQNAIANCTLTLAFDNRVESSVELYEDIQVSVLRRNRTLMVANAQSFYQGYQEQRPVVVGGAGFSLGAADFPSAYNVTYSFGVKARSTVRMNPGTDIEKMFYIKGVCKDVKVGFLANSEVGTMLDGTQTCRLYHAYKHPFDL